MAQFVADDVAKILGGTPDRSRTGELDEMLNAEHDIYVPAGADGSRWINTGEFEHIAEKWGRCDEAFGMGDETGLSIEISFGSSSALLELMTDQPHPVLGAAF
jgi:hypothetical protein